MKDATFGVRSALTSTSIPPNIREFPAPPGTHHAFPISRKLRAWVFRLIKGTNPPSAIREIFLPPLDIEMPVRNPFGRTLPKHIHTQLKTPISSSSGKDSFPSVGPGAHDNTVVPSYHESRARTLVLCFDGTGDQFSADVRISALTFCS